MGKRRFGEGGFSDPEQALELLEQHFGITKPSWAVSLHAMSAHGADEYQFLQSARISSGSRVDCEWLILSSRAYDVFRLERDGRDYPVSLGSPDEIMRFEFALAITEYNGGRITAIEVVPTAYRPPESLPSIEEPPPEASLDRLGAALEEISREPGQE